MLPASTENQFRKSFRNLIPNQLTSIQISNQTLSIDLYESVTERQRNWFCDDGVEENGQVRLVQIRGLKGTGDHLDEKRERVVDVPGISCTIKGKGFRIDLWKVWNR